MLCAGTESLAEIRQVLSGKWKLEILYVLSEGPLRWHMLMSRLPDAAPKVLTRQLQSLIADGLLYRITYTSHPPHTVEYGLTEKGRQIVPLVRQLALWSCGCSTEG